MHISFAFNPFLQLIFNLIIRIFYCRFYNLIFGLFFLRTFFRSFFNCLTLDFGFFYKVFVLLSRSSLEIQVIFFPFSRLGSFWMYFDLVCCWSLIGGSGLQKSKTLDWIKYSELLNLFGPNLDLLDQLHFLWLNSVYS